MARRVNGRAENSRSGLEAATQFGVLFYSTRALRNTSHPSIADTSEPDRMPTLASDKTSGVSNAKIADEDRHRKADAGQTTRAMNVPPGERGGKLGQSCPHRDPREDRHAKRLSDHQTHARYFRLGELLKRNHEPIDRLGA